MLQGVSHWNVSFKLTLTDRNMQVRFYLKVDLECWNWIFLGITISFQKSNTDWPHQPPTDMLPILVKNWIFDDPFHKKGLVLVNWVPGMIKPSGSVDFWWNKAAEVIEAIEAVEATEVIEAAEELRPGKSILRTSESSRNWDSALFLCFEKKFFELDPEI